MSAYDDWIKSEGGQNWAKLQKIQSLAQQRQKPQHPKGFWTDQISTGGGIGGALAGAAGGAAIGSVVPVVGTAIGGLLGAILGGGLGSAGGEVAENAITGNKLDKDVLKEGLLGAATSIPLGAGLKLAGAGVKAATGLGKSGVRELLEQAGEKTIPRIVKPSGGQVAEAAVKQSGKPNATRGLANKVYAQMWTVPRRQAHSLKPQETAQELMNYGIKGTRDAIGDTAGKAVAGIGKILNQSVEGVGGHIKTGDVTSIANNALRGVAISGPERKALMETLTDIGTHGKLPGYASPSEVLEAIRKLEDRGYKKINAANSALAPNPTLGEVGDAYVQAAKELEDNLYDAIRSTGSLKKLQTKENADILNGVVKGLGDKFMAAKDPAEVRSLMAPFVRARQLNSLTEDAAQSTMNQGLQSNGLAGIIRNPVVRGVEEAIRAPLTTTVGSAAGKLAGTGARAAAKPVGQSLTGLATRQTIGQNVGSMQQPQAGASDLTDMTPPQPGVPTSLTDALMASQGDEWGGITPEQIQGAMANALLAGDTKAFDSYAQLYKLMQASQPQQTSTGLTRPTTQQYSMAQSGLSALSQLADLIRKDPSVISRSAIPGQNLPAIGGLISNAAGTGDYHALANNIIDAIARARTGAAMTKSEEAFYRRMLPQPGDNPQTVQTKLAQLQQAFEPFIPQTGQSVGTSLMDLVAQGY